jgi:hypothetical protein
MAKRALFVQLENGMWEFRGETYEQHIGQWKKVDSEVQADKWKLSAVAASLDTRYKDDTIGKFAKEVKRTPRRIRQYAQTYRVFENGKRFPSLSFHHHTVAAQADDPTAAMQKAEDGEWSTRELEHFIKTGEEPTTEEQPERHAPQVKLSPVFQKIHDDAVRAELEDRIGVVRGWTEPVDPILSIVYRRLIDLLEWQRDRTVDRDCAAILSIFQDSEEMDTEGLECASEADIQTWLRMRGFIMSEDELDDRLSLMEQVHMLYIRSRKKSKGANQRGVVTGVYEIHAEYLGLMADAEDSGEQPPTAMMLSKALEEQSGSGEAVSSAA